MCRALAQAGYGGFPTAPWVMSARCRRAELCRISPVAVVPLFGEFCMATPRYRLVDPDNACDYHLVSRVVRRSWLFGWDQLTQRDYSHRKPQLIARIKRLAHCFAVEIYAYSVMSNHYHLVARFDPTLCESWSDEEVARRWMEVYPPPVSDPADLEAKKEELVELLVGDRNRIERRRRTLGSLSGFMQHLNQPIARQANLEDGCEGHFFQHRFYSGALLSEEAVIAAMAYVDLNPVRAKIAERIEDCAGASIHERLQENSAVALTDYLRPVASGLQHWLPDTPRQAAGPEPVAVSPSPPVLPPRTPLEATITSTPATSAGEYRPVDGTGHEVDSASGVAEQLSVVANVLSGPVSEPARLATSAQPEGSGPEGEGVGELSSLRGATHEGKALSGSVALDTAESAGSGRSARGSTLPPRNPRPTTARCTTLGTYLALLRSTVCGKVVPSSDGTGATAGSSEWLTTWQARVVMIRKRQRAFGGAEDLRKWARSRGLACRDGPLPV